LHCVSLKNESGRDDAPVLAYSPVTRFPAELSRILTTE